MMNDYGMSNPSQPGLSSDEEMKDELNPNDYE